MTELTPHEFLKKYTPTPDNQICTCAGQYVCVYCNSSRIIRDLVGPQVDTPAQIRECQLDNLPLSRLQLVFFNAVRKAGDAGLAVTRLIDTLYADDPDGGPLDPHSAVRSIRRNLNKQLRSYGWVITSLSRGGPVENFIRLEPLPDLGVCSNRSYEEPA